MKSMRIWYRNLTFRRKVLLSFLLVSLIPVLILGTFSYLQTRNLLIRREKDGLKETLNQSVITLDSNLATYKNVMDNIVWDTQLKQALAKRYENNYEMYLMYRDVIDPMLLRVRNLNPQINQLSLYSANTTLNAHGGNLMEISRLEELPFELSDYRIHWQADTQGHMELYCGIYPEIYQEENVVYMSVDYEAVFGFLRELFQQDYGVLITDEKQKPVFTYSDFSDSRLNGNPDVGQMIETGELEQYVLEKTELPISQWTVYLYRPLAVISRSALSITAMVAVMVGICIVIIMILSFALTRSVVYPLQRLIENMDMIEEGNFSVNIKAQGKDEIGLLIGRFRAMVQRLNHLVNEVYKSKIDQQAYEMRALQAQINPHFLYNSLSLINWKAIMAEQEEISEMTQLLSTFYRTTLNKGRNVTTVKGEWENTCSYVRIQNMLHSGKLQLTMEIEDTILEYEILNLLLQPLVENAIVHGLDHKTGPGEKVLRITGKKERENLIFIVEDNGCGMPEETLKDILTVESKGYGVQNVHHRIQLCYGQGYGLFFESKPGVGTRVVLRIPIVIQSEEE